MSVLPDLILSMQIHSVAYLMAQSWAHSTVAHVPCDIPPVFQWYMLTIVHIYNRWRNNEICCYVDGEMVSCGEMAWPLSTSDVSVLTSALGQHGPETWRSPFYTLGGCGCVFTSVCTVGLIFVVCLTQLIALGLEVLFANPAQAHIWRNFPQTQAAEHDVRDQFRS